MLYCTNCGKENKPGTENCIDCNLPLSEANIWSGHDYAEADKPDKDGKGLLNYVSITKPNVPSKMVIDEPKSQALGFILTLIFGPFGLLYSAMTKAALFTIVLIVLGVAGYFISWYAVYGVAGLIWILSIYSSFTAIKECNERIARQHAGK